MALSKKQTEDTWAWVEIGSQFPAGVVRVKGEQNQYIALWYKNGKSVHGRAWNDGGVVAASFPYGSKELTGAKALGGQIQILTYETDYEKCGYWYEWTAWSKRKEAHYQMVRCGPAAPIMIVSKAGAKYMGNMDMNTEEALASFDGKTEVVKGGACNDLLTVVRNLRKPDAIMTHDDTWVDLRVGDAFPPMAVQALGRPLTTDTGSGHAQYVALWYKHGAPTMGRVWPDSNGKVQASFGVDNHEHTGAIGSLQVLTYDPAGTAFQIEWKPYSEAMKRQSWFPVHVGDSAPCVVKSDKGHELLGKVGLAKEKASAAWNNKEMIVDGPKVGELQVLCRSAKYVA